MFWTSLTQPEAMLYAAVIGASGAILGGMVATFLTQLIGARVQRRRQWDEVRHVAYARVIEAFYAAWGLYDEAGRLQADRTVVRRAIDELLTAYARAVLLTRANRTAAALEQLHTTAQDLWDRPKHSWVDIDQACRHAERNFRLEARSELGLSKRRGVAKPPTESASTGTSSVPGQSPPLPAAGLASSNESFTANTALSDDEHR